MCHSSKERIAYGRLTLNLIFLDAGCTVTFLLRSPDIFDSDEVIQKYIKSGKAKVLKGDALVKDDVKRSWDEAAKSRQVDLLLFTVGE